MRLAIAIGLGLLKVTGGIAIGIAMLLVGTWLHVQGSLPAYSGRLEAKGLKAPVEIVRDANAVPHIIAGSLEDAAFGLGFVHAQDRFWQMELMRRLGQGRLAELVPPRLVGQGLIESDRTMRGLGVYRRAAESVAALSPATRATVEAYAAGVNAWLADEDQQFGLELTLVKLLAGGDYRPEPWQPADSLVWAKIMALGLDGNWRGELLRLRLAAKIGVDATQSLLNSRGESADATLQLALQAMRDAPLDRLWRETGNHATTRREASNEWVLSGARTLSGKPLLANDPHLGLSFPGTWYLARLVGPGFDIRGATSPGSPGVVLGHNGTIAWGFTTTGLDSQDLFIERVDPTNPARYIAPEGARPFAVRDETIRVRWGEPVTLKVRETRHGPVIDDFIRRADGLAPAQHVLALQATALDGADTSLEGFLFLGLARNWEDFQAAARRIVSPMQNIVYADTGGNIGLVSPARVPIRRQGDGSVPVPGWTGDHDWAGFVPFEELPRLYNPPGGLIVNANARLVPDGYRHLIASDWAEPWRQRRADRLLREIQRHPVYGMIAAQADNLSTDAAELLPLLLAPAARSVRAARALTLLGNWNGFMLAGRPEPMIYAVWLRELQRGLIADELGEDLFLDVAGPNVGSILRILREQRGWCDDGTTREQETCDDIIARSLDRALDWITRRHGPDMDRWQWGDEHRAAHRHPLFDAIPLLRELASVRFPSDGGAHTLNRASYSLRGERGPFEATHGAGYRAVYDLDNPDGSRFGIPLGQSGNLASPWARHFVAGWRTLSYIAISGTRAEIQRTAIGTFSLQPR